MGVYEDLLKVISEIGPDPLDELRRAMPQPVRVWVGRWDGMPEDKMVVWKPTEEYLALTKYQFRSVVWVLPAAWPTVRKVLDMAAIIYEVGDR